MNTPETLARSVGFGIGQELTISGYLTVCADFSYLSASEDADAPENSKAILISNSTIADRLLDAGFPVRVGTMVQFFGKATVSGLLNATGLTPFPVAFYQLRTLDFEDEQNQVHLSFGPDR